MSGLLYYGVLAVAAGIDIATFYQVLALVMKNVPDEVVWLGTVGFTVTALSLAQTMGVRARDRIDEGGRALGSASVWLLFVIWLFVGGTAFIVRLTAAPPSASGGTTIVEDGQQIIAPLTRADNPMLAHLCHTSPPPVAAIAGYLRHNTAAKQYAVTLRTRASAAKLAAASAGDLALAQQTKVALEEERRRRAEGWQKAQEEWHAIARRLKQEARLRLASAAQDPSTTDAYFVPPQSVEPVGGAPSGMPVAMPSVEYPLRAALPTHRRLMAPPQRYHSPYGVAVPVAPPAVSDQAPQWRLNANPGAHRPIDHGSTTGSERWEGGR
jgi:hypothetical protein